MGQKNEHSAFKVTSVMKTNTNITPSVDMNQSRVIKRHNILEHHKVSFVANNPESFPEDPEVNEITYKSGQLWIYSKRGEILQWSPISGGEGGGSILNIPAVNIVEDSGHRFVTNTQLTAIQQVVDGIIPATKILQDSNHQFLNQYQVNALNNLIEGVEIDGGDLL